MRELYLLKSVKKTEGDIQINKKLWATFHVLYDIFLDVVFLPFSMIDSSRKLFIFCDDCAWIVIINIYNYYLNCDYYYLQLLLPLSG